ncbi:MAG: hypothetical protein N3B68_05035 [Anaerolineae bacterium]|nr:hypothetical protein [Anaerolineae bacterium]
MVLRRIAYFVVRVFQKVSALMTADWLEERARRGDRGRFEQALAKVPDVEPDI